MKQMSTNHPKPEASDKLENHILSFNSTTLKELCKQLLDDNKNIIGLYGPRGSGKTKLVELVRDKSKSLKSFAAVLFGTVSPNPVTGVIRYQSAEWSNLKVGGYRSKTALKSQQLGSMNRILVILDDVPANFDPEKKIRINPCSDRRWKFLLTTRREQKCTLMIGKTEIPCETMIPMRPLSDEDNWTLLQEKLGIEDDDKSPSNLQLLDVAKKVALPCNKLPGTIMKLGSFFQNSPLISGKNYQNLGVQSKNYN